MATPSAEPVSQDAPSQPTAETEPQPQSEPSQPIPGPRAKRFLEVHASALSITLKTLSLPAFLSCFPLLAASAPDVMKTMHAQLISRLESFAQADFQEILRERKVIENLNALEELIADAKRRKAAFEEAHPDGTAQDEEGRIPGHLQPPDALLAAHLAGTLEAARGKLNAREQTLQGRNEVLFEEVKQQWKEIEELTRGVEVLAEDLVGAGELMDEAGK